ncbi:MAG: hypothetical protein K2P39_04905 [Lachnospiraceae bacterium]|nr:hypothetical protein [Lachnospiraceae bacterium]
MYTTNPEYSATINNPHVNSTTFPDNFSIVNMQAALSFTESIVLDANDGGEKADTLIIGNYSGIRELGQYTTDTMAGVLGTTTQGMDLGFSLIWSGQTLTAGASKTYSFNQGIVNLDTDDNIPDTVIKTPTVDIAPAPPKPVLVKKDYMGGENQLWIQSGGEALDGLVLKVGAMNTGVLNIDDISTLAEWKADEAIDRVSCAIAEISKQRSVLGAYQNRLEHTIANENNIVENTTAAESQIRDTDMAKEMVQYSNKNILLQAGQSMLSQANQSRQGILSLLAA